MKGRARRAIRLAKLLWNWEPHPTQREWLECEAKVKVAACGRRWGKTEAAAVDAAGTAILKPGCAQMIVSPSYDQSRLIFGTIERLLLGSPITRPITQMVKTPYPQLRILGSRISARTADEDGRNLRGHAADRVIVDEAAYVRDSVIAEVISPMLADSDGELVMISTPFGKNHFYRTFTAGRDRSPDCASFTFPSVANPHVSREYIERQRRELSPRQFAVEYEAQFAEDVSCVFAWEDVEAAAARYAGQVDDSAKPAWVTAGIDWARYSDYTALVAVESRGERIRVIGIDRFNRMSWDAQVRRAAEFIRLHRAAAVLADQTSIGDPLLEQLRAHLQEVGADVVVDGLVFTGPSKRDLIEQLSARFSRGHVAIPRDDRLMRELHYFEYEITPSGGVRMNARPGHSDDLVIALALACRQAREGLPSAAMLVGSDRATAAGW